jgi:plasmid stabilization system protein ParE
MAAALHVTNGDCTDLQGTGLADRVLVWFDVLHEGPVPAVADEEFRRIRAAHLTKADPAGAREFVEDRFRDRDETLASHRDGTYVLWFEADLYDQLQIVQILARLAALGVSAERITLICIGEYPGIPRFGGLGELTASQLRALPTTGAGATLTPGALELATRAWTALRQPDPGSLGEIAAVRSPELRFLGEAFDRLSREYPSTREGLSLTERRILAAVDGRRSAGEVFTHAAAREFRPYLGDTWCFATMERMIQAPEPLLTSEPADRPTGFRSRLRLTDAGAQVLAGERDHITDNGIDRWIGGVHLGGRNSAWRFDEGTEAVIATG